VDSGGCTWALRTTNNPQLNNPIVTACSVFRHWESSFQIWEKLVHTGKKSFTLGKSEFCHVCLLSLRLSLYLYILLSIVRVTVRVTSPLAVSSFFLPSRIPCLSQMKRALALLILWVFIALLVLSLLFNRSHISAIPTHDQHSVYFHLDQTLPLFTVVIVTNDMHKSTQIATTAHVLLPLLSNVIIVTKGGTVASSGGPNGVIKVSGERDEKRGERSKKKRSKKKRSKKKRSKKKRSKKKRSVSPAASKRFARCLEAQRVAPALTLTLHSR